MDIVLYKSRAMVCQSFSGDRGLFQSPIWIMDSLGTASSHDWFCVPVKVHQTGQCIHNTEWWLRWLYMLRHIYRTP